MNDGNMEVVAPASADEQQAAGQEDVALTEESWLEQRLKSQQAVPPPESEEEEETPDGQVSDDPEEESEEREQEEDPLAELEISDEEREFIEANPESRLAKRIGQLVKQRKEAEEKLKQALAAQQRSEDDPLKSEPEAVPESIAKLDSLEAIRDQVAQTDKFIEWAEDLLFDNTDELPDAVIHEEGGQQFTKKQVRAALRDRQKDRRQHLPERARQLQMEKQREHETEHFRSQVEKELPWAADEESETYKAWQATLNDPRLDKIRAAAPEIAPRLDYLLAHALNSIQGAPQAPASKPQKPIQPGKPKPPGMPGGNAASPPPRSDNKRAKMLEDSLARARETGSEDAILKALTVKNTP